MSQLYDFDDFWSDFRVAYLEVLNRFELTCASSEACRLDVWYASGQTNRERLRELSNLAAMAREEKTLREWAQQQEAHWNLVQMRKEEQRQRQIMREDRAFEHSNLRAMRLAELQQRRADACEDRTRRANCRAMSREDRRSRAWQTRTEMKDCRLIRQLHRLLERWEKLRVRHRRRMKAQHRRRMKAQQARASREVAQQAR